MKVREAIDLVDKIKPNSFSDDEKFRWLSECEGLVGLHVQHRPLEALASLQVPGDDQTVLSVPFPLDKLYWLYLTAMIDYANGEYTKYLNSQKAYNEAERDYHNWYIRNNHKCWQDGQCGGAVPYADNPI